MHIKAVGRKSPPSRVVKTSKVIQQGKATATPPAPMHDTRQKISIQEIFGLFKGPWGFYLINFVWIK